MQLVKLKTYYEGYYGGKYYEEIILSKEFIEKYNIQEGEDEVDLGEIEGKHSCCFGDLIIEPIENNTDINIKKSDGECLEDYLKDYFKYTLEIGYEILMQEEQKVKDYLKTLDKIIKYEVKIKESNIPKLEEFLKTL